MNQLDFLIKSVETLLEEENISKQVIATLNRIKEILKSEQDIYIKKDKCVHELEELEANGNVEAGIRVQLLDISSTLEQL